ncbi:hypothetical protein [Staphylococcus equorum]
MKVKDQQPYILDNELGSREEVEIDEQRIKELEEYDEQEDKNPNNKIIIFTTILIFILTIILSVIIQTNKKQIKSLKLKTFDFDTKLLKVTKKVFLII